MSDKKRVAERNRGLMLSPSDMGGAVMVPTNSLIVGPGKPGPGDEWHFPDEPAEGTSDKTVPGSEPIQSAEVEPSGSDR